MPATNAPLGQAMEWTPPKAQTGWTLLQSVPGNQTSVTIPNTWSAEAKAGFFVLTASNRLGESFFSNVAWIPANPSDKNNVRATLNR